MWIQEAAGQRVQVVVAVAAPLLVVVDIIDHVLVRPLPRRRARVVVHIVHSVARVDTTLPPAR